MKIIPLEDRALIKPDEKEERVGSILIPDTVQKKPIRGEIIGIGDGEEISEKLQKGDIVFFGKYAGEEIEVDGQKLLLVKYEDILAKII